MSSPLLAGVAQMVPAFEVPGFDWKTLVPLVWLGSNAAAAAVTSGWQSLMTALWAGGLWVTGFAFKIVDAFTNPDLSEGGVMNGIYPATFAVGGALALILGFLQIGAAAWQRDGKGLARVLVGVAQFALAWGGMLGVGAALSVATAGLTQGMLQVALGAPSFASVNLLASWQPRQGVDAAVATVLGVCGLFLVLAAIGHLLVMLVRAGALVILMATSPICAAGLLSEGTRAWFWKSLRWFLAALMIAPLSALVLGVGKKLTDGVLSGAGTGTEAAVGQGVIGTVLVIISAFCPLILFRLLAFVDPGTSSGASFRASLDAAGGLGALLGAGGQESSGGGAATAQASDGSSQGEADAGASTQGRLATAMGALGTAAQHVSSLGQDAATYGADILGAAGVGDQQPYFGSPASNDNRANGPSSPQPQSSRKGQSSQNGQGSQNGQNGKQGSAAPGNPEASSGSDTATGAVPAMPVPSPPRPAPSPALPSAGAGGKGAKPAAGGAAASGGGEAGAASAAV